jgi:butyrate kinase
LPPRRKSCCSPTLILVINPGSTSTKLAIFRGVNCLDQRTLAHSTRELRRFKCVADQEEWRAGLVQKYLKGLGVAATELVATVGRGGLLRPVNGGTYRVNARMKRELRAAEFGEHASNLGALLADRVARAGKCPAFIVDPVVVDELEPEARLSGLPELPRRSVFHALSQRAAARRACTELGLSYSRARLVVAHLGGGISVGAHRNGRVVEVNNALDGEGPMSAERAGTLPAGDLVRLALGRKYRRDELLKLISGGGGLVAHLGTNDLKEVARRLARNQKKAKLVFGALAHGISRAICGCFAALRATPQAIVLTGGMCRCKLLVREIRKRTGFAAPLLVYTDNLEMPALAAGALRVLRGRERAKNYG